MDIDFEDPTTIPIKTLMDMRRDCDESLLYFTRLFYKVLRGAKFIVSDHHKDLAYHFDLVRNYKTKLLNINIPPRHSKTELALNFIARGIGENPASNWLYVSASDELRGEASTRIRDIITHPLYKAMYGLELKKNQKSKNLWRTTKGGGLKTATIFGQVTGFGAGQMTEAGFNKTLNLIRTFEGAQVWDDINKTEDSQAENAINDKVSRVIFNTLLSRENSFDTPIIHIQQRTGMSDATASLMDHYGYGTDRLSDKIKFVIMPIIKEDGTPLWESKFPMSEINKLKTSPKTAHVFEAQYMQNPQPSDEVLFPANQLSYFTMDDIKGREVLYTCAAIDVADEGLDNLSMPICKVINKTVYVVDWFFAKDNMEITIPQVAGLVRVHNIDLTICEINGNGSGYLKGLQRESNANFLPLSSKGNKHLRIGGQAAAIKLRFAFRSDVKAGTPYHKAMTQLTRYAKVNGKNNKDDAPDSVSMVSKFLQYQFPDIFFG